jgi:hypothetical protein
MKSTITSHLGTPQLGVYRESSVRFTQRSIGSETLRLPPVHRSKRSPQPAVPLLLR